MRPVRPWLVALVALRPRPVAGAMALVALGWLMAVLAAMVLLANPDLEGIAVTGYITGLFGAGPALLVLLVAAVFAGSWPSRALVLHAAALVAAVGAAGLSTLGLANQGEGALIVSGIVGSLAAIPVLIVAIAALAATAVGLLDVLRALRDERVQRADQWLDARGYALLTELGRALAVRPGVAGDIAVEAGAELDADGAVAWHPEGREQRVQVLAGLLGSRGRIHLAALSEELRLREDLVRPLLAWAVSTRAIEGGVSFEDDVVRRGEAVEDTGCPRCGDTLVQAGHGVRQCPACDVELFGP